MSDKIIDPVGIRRKVVPEKTIYNSLSEEYQAKINDYEETGDPTKLPPPYQTIRNNIIGAQPSNTSYTEIRVFRPKPRVTFSHGEDFYI